MRPILTCLAIFLSSLALYGTATAQPAETSTVLTVSGQISAGAAGGTARERSFTLSDLEALPQTTLTTYTDWTVGPQSFSGVLLKDLLEFLGASGTEIVATALNDYTATIPYREVFEIPVLIAIKQNGRYMRIREMGPLWIIYPSDTAAERHVNPYNDRMVWQLFHLEIR